MTPILLRAYQGAGLPSHGFFLRFAATAMIIGSTRWVLALLSAGKGMADAGVRSGATDGL